MGNDPAVSDGDHDLADIIEIIFNALLLDDRNILKI
jgi:hypothetical protein